MLAVATFCALAPTTAQAEQFRPAWVASNYTGWSYVSTSRPTAPVWKWTAAGWQSSALRQGQPVWAAPFSGSWQWAWVGGSWYAAQTTLLAKWSCTPKTTPGEAPGAVVRVALHQFNTSGSAVLGYTRPEAGDNALCMSLFPDAAISKGSAADLGVYCSIPASPTDDPACVVAPAVYVLVRVHVDPCGTADGGERAGCTPTLVVRSGYLNINEIPPG